MILSICMIRRLNLNMMKIGEIDSGTGLVTLVTFSFLEM